MAGKVNNNTWFIWVLLIIAGAFVVMAFSKEKPAAKPAPVAASTAPVAVTAVPLSDVQTIKPAHLTAAPAEVVKPKVIPSVVVPPQDVPAHDVLAVQVYSFKDKTRAETALRAIKDKGYTAYIMVSDLGVRGIWYRVRVGTFSNETDARKALDRLTKDFKSGVIVTE